MVCGLSGGGVVVMVGGDLDGMLLVFMVWSGVVLPP